MDSTHAAAIGAATLVGISLLRTGPPPLPPAQRRAWQAALNDLADRARRLGRPVQSVAWAPGLVVYHPGDGFWIGQRVVGSRGFEGGHGPYDSPHAAATALWQRQTGSANESPAMRVLVQKDLPLPPFQRFEGRQHDESPGAGSVMSDGVWSWWAWASLPWVQMRARAESDGRWSVWAGYPGDRDTWRLRVKGRAADQLEALDRINGVLRGDALIAGGAFPTLPELLPPTHTYEEWVEQSRARAAAARTQDERERRQRIADTGEGYYPELLTDWPMSRSASEGRPWRTVSDDGRVQHRVEKHPSWGRNHHLRLFIGGEPVAGITLVAKRPWRGQQTVTISTVYTAEGHRRQGYARELLQAARAHFRRVHHSKDLTGAGRKWKRGVGNRRSW